MDPQSPPKRMTRARAAAKASEPTGPKTTKIVTAAAKAKATRPATTATKRKTRSDDHEDEHTDSESEHQAKAATKVTRGRGRPKKVVEPAVEPDKTEQEAPAPARHTRGRAAKKVAQESVQEEAPKVVRRTRAKKTQPDEEEEAVAEPPKKAATRGRAATGTKPAVKKTVKFEEPDKENVAPAAAKGKAATKTAETSGLRARPVRKPAATTGRGTRATAKSSSHKGHEDTAPKPLSPKKVTQIARSARHQDVESDDELAIMVGTPLKPLARSPVKPSVSLRVPALNQSKEPVGPEEGGKAPEASEPPVSTILGSPVRRPAPSPYKDAMKSPARRVLVPNLSAPVTQSDSKMSQPSFKASLLQSPAKRPQSPVKALVGSTSNRLETNQTPFKLSLLGSPAKRPFSPFKPVSPVKEAEPTSMLESPVTKPLLLATPLPEALPEDESLDRDADDEIDMVLQEMQSEAMQDSPTRLKFPGRLSAVLPRHADPALKEPMLVLPEVADDEDELQAPAEWSNVPADVEDSGDPMVLDEPDAEALQPGSTSTTPPHSPPKQFSGVLGLRQKDLQPVEDSDSDSDDELAPRFNGRVSSLFDTAPATPCPATSSKTPRMQTAHAFSSKRASGFGFTPLANQLSGWTATSPLKPAVASQTLKAGELASIDENRAPSPAGRSSVGAEETPMKSTFFEDEMSVRPDASVQPKTEALGEATPSPVSEEIGFDALPVTDEDVALAVEANEMSILDPEQVEDLVNLDGADDSMSEASQEYGDENAIPVDPALQPAEDPAVPLVTPQRMIRREFHTVSKVPLKPAHESTPRPVKKRSHSISRLPVQRPSYGLTRNATVISYSPMKARQEEHPLDVTENTQRHQRATSAPPVTPTKSEVGWSTAGTPARTPRRDINPALLRGAVVYVDVHTSEGADASGIFVELLTHMGARCVKSWPWNPTSPPGKEASSSSSRIGITHVVYKDGGKRTLEKVRESGGVVQCVGVSWVLDCERENEWLDEAPYYIDTSFVPRGGARRRKSMEPKALANLNGMLVPTPMRNANSGANARESQSAPATPVNRRDSGLWMRTPEDEADFDDAEVGGLDDSEWDAAMLTPVPVTPAPEAIARFALEVTPDTPSTDMSGVDSPAAREALMTRTCPPKRTSSYAELGAGLLSREKDEGVLQRLMAARRKSLQFAPKIGSPLSKAWN